MSRGAPPPAGDPTRGGRVGRPHRVAVERRTPGELLRLALAVGADFPELAAVTPPGDVGEPLPVGRPGGLELAPLDSARDKGVAAGQPPGLSRRQGPDAEPG